MEQQKPPTTVLAIDGGGIRGLVPLLLLKALIKILRENGCQDELNDIFTVIAGTSTGGIIASGIRHGKTIDQLLELYLNKRRKIFSPLKFGSTNEFIGLGLAAFLPIGLRFFYSSPSLTMQQRLLGLVHFDWQEIKHGMAFGFIVGALSCLKKRKTLKKIQKFGRTFAAWTVFGAFTDKLLPKDAGFWSILKGAAFGGLFGLCNGALFAKNRLKAIVDGITYAIYGSLPFISHFESRESLCPVSNYTHNLATWGKWSYYVRLIFPAIFVGLLDHTDIIPNTISPFLLTKYQREGLDTLLSDTFGAAHLEKLKSIVMPSIQLTYDTTTKHYGASIQLFTEQEDAEIAMAVGATSAAPTYFRPKGDEKTCYLDGGLFANNPSFVSLLYLASSGEVIDPKKDQILLLSLGTAGGNPKLSENLVKAHTGQLGWIKNVLDLQGITSYLEDELDWLQELTDKLGHPMFSNRYRIQLENTEHKIELDKISNENIDKILQLVGNQLASAEDNSPRNKLRMFARKYLGREDITDPFKGKEPVQIVKELLQPCKPIMSCGCPVWRLLKPWLSSPHTLLQVSVNSLSMLAIKQSFLSPWLDHPFSSAITYVSSSVIAHLLCGRSIAKIMRQGKLLVACVQAVFLFGAMVVPYPWSILLRGIRYTIPSLFRPKQAKEKRKKKHCFVYASHFEVNQFWQNIINKVQSM